MISHRVSPGTRFATATESSEEQRHYKNPHLDTCEVLDGKVETSIFIAESRADDCEICFSFGVFHGIAYVDEASAYGTFDGVKNELGSKNGTATVMIVGEKSYTGTKQEQLLFSGPSGL